MSVTIKADTSGLDSLLDQLGGAVDEAVRPAAQTAAQVLYDEVKRRVPVSDGAHWFHGTHQKYFFRSGTLRDSIYQVYSKKKSGRHRATYHVSWNHTKAPYGFMVEYGTSRAPAHPFVRPAVAKFDAAMDAAEAELLRRIDEAEK